MKDITAGRLQRLLANLDKEIVPLEAVFNEVERQLKHIELIQVDLLHIVELETFSSVRGYHLAKKLKEVRLERRAIKDRWEELKIALDSLKETRTKTKEQMLVIREMRSRLDDRKYHIRKLDGDFDIHTDCIVRRKK
ncbi:hypothetical protein CN604_24710 [Bacillus wiedmannii]|uniref:hypothetical protein n=1 Tax=Bacillus wiedmannii TaxID=1890302 RepID=UPI000BF09F6F|nr:hypothetical protein [Bacillus wiedmannii]PEL95781.1 hypothetical protein CN604_24710 [Bacillus wiedmannii]